MPYNKGATKTMNAMKKQYGSNWAHVYYGLANKRAGKGLKGKHRGHKAANKAYAKGAHWSTTSKRRGRVHSTVRLTGAARKHNVRVRIT